MSTATVARAPSQTVTPGRAQLSQRRLSRPAVAIGALTLLAAIVRFVGLAHQSYWFDEADTVSIVHTSLGGLLVRVPRWETTPPFYFFAAWLWAHVFGSGEAGLRSLSALAGVITVPIGYAAASKLISRRVGVILAALIACSPLLVWYSQEARAYSLLVLLTSVALLAFAHLRSRPTLRWTVIWTLAGVLALATHYYAALTIVPEGILLLARHGRVRRTRIGVVVVALSGLALLAIAFRQFHNLGVSNWINRIPLSQRVADLPREFAIGPNGPASLWLAVAAAIIVGVSVWLTVSRASRDERQSLRAILLIAAAGFGLVFALIVLGFDQLNTRNMLALWLPMALFIAAGLGARRAGAIGAAATVTVCAVGLATVIGVAVDPRLQRPAWRNVARVVNDSAVERAVFTVNGCQTLPLSLYVPGLHFAPANGTVVREVDVITAANQGSWYKVVFSGWFVICKPQRHPVTIPRRLAGLRAVGQIVHINQFSVLRLTSAVPVRVTQGTFEAAGLSGALMVAPRPSSRATSSLSSR